jgi:hypothetical protein
VSRMKIKAVLLGSAIALSGCSQEAAPPPSAGNAQPYVVHCTEAIPEFTLGPRSHPTKEQEAHLCGCIWSKYDKEWERDTSEKIAHKQEVSEFYQRAFIGRFGSAVRQCGGYDL